MDQVIAFLKRLALRVARAAAVEVINEVLEESRAATRGMDVSPEERVRVNVALDILAQKLVARF